MEQTCEFPTCDRLATVMVGDAFFLFFCDFPHSRDLPPTQVWEGDYA